MNSRLASEENKLEIKWILERAERVSKVRGITQKEAVEYGRKIKQKYATNDSERCAIDIRHNEALKYITNE